jgi:hypothetical protein
MRIFLARAMMILFALRALVPAGVMPDLGALGGWQLNFVICTAHGDTEMPVAPDSGAPQKLPGADCPFGMTLAKSLALPSLLVLELPSLAQSRFVPATAFAGLLPPPLGPPLGSRAPPLA